MLIAKHSKLPYVLRELRDRPAWRWLALQPKELTLVCMVGPALVADWIVRHGSDLLQLDELRVLVIGTVLDTTEDGLFWSTVAGLVGKQPGWIACRVIGERAQMPNLLRRNAPAFATERCERIEAPINALGAQTAFRDEVDLLVVTRGAERTMADLLSGAPAVLSALCEGATKAVMTAGTEGAAALLTAIPQASGMTVGVETNRFYDVVEDEAMGWARHVCWCWGPPGKPLDQKRVEGLANDVAMIAEANADLDPQLPWVEHEPEDFTQWGSEGLSKSSVDANDTFIALPRGYAMRRASKEVVKVRDDLIEVEGFGVASEEVLADLDGRGESWLERAGWAAALWLGGLGERVDSTLAGHMERMGMKTGPDLFDEFLAGVDIPEDSKELIKKALTGGPPYSPKREERVLFSLLSAGDVAGALRAVEEDLGLANAMNERRRPALAALAERGTPSDVLRMVELGADPDGTDGGGRPVLCDAAEAAPVECVAALLDCHADINGYDPMGWTALLMAMARGRWDVAGMLVERGADVDWVGASGLSAVDLVRGKKSPIGDGLDVLKEAGKVLGLEGDSFVNALHSDRAFLVPGEIPEWLRSKVVQASAGDGTQ